VIFHDFNHDFNYVFPWVSMIFHVFFHDFPSQLGISGKNLSRPEIRTDLELLERLDSLGRCVAWLGKPLAICDEKSVFFAWENPGISY
jgi:hypothetical protein